MPQVERGGDPPTMDDGQLITDEAVLLNRILHVTREIRVTLQQLADRLGEAPGGQPAADAFDMSHDDARAHRS